MELENDFSVVLSLEVFKNIKWVVGLDDILKVNFQSLHSVIPWAEVVLQIQVYVENK